MEELLPGYLLDGEVERPALVIVNRLAGAGCYREYRKACRFSAFSSVVVVFWSTSLISPE